MKKIGQLNFFGLPIAQVEKVKREAKRNDKTLLVIGQAMIDLYFSTSEQSRKEQLSKYKNRQSGRNLK